MANWENVCTMLLNGESVGQIKEKALKGFEQGQVYADSIHSADGCYFFLAVVQGVKKLVICGDGKAFSDFTGSQCSLPKGKAKICDMSNENCALIRKLFPFTNPSNHHGKAVTVGFGDRLGLASPGHIRTIKGKEVFPVLAQQSIRELNLTGRTYKDVLAAASWAVFQEGYTLGFGADGDHLKTAQEVNMAIDCGFTMITLDCSEHIDNSIPSLGADEVNILYAALSKEDRKRLETKYLDREIVLDAAHAVHFKPEEFKRTVLIYLDAIKYTIDIYNDVIRNCGRNIDFEMSIDETLTSTTPQSHYFVASELLEAGVRITSLAPRFCGEFQKAIDYIGEIAQFRKEFEVHAIIAEKLGYKLSIHSGSDKFSVFPTIGEMTKLKVHLKTAGTNWLEAVRIIAARNPALYRRMHAFALKHLSEAKKYYHISAKPENIPTLDKLSDGELPGLMEQNDARQVLHITYGLILLAKNADGTSTFKDEIYSLLNQHEAEYYSALQKHLGRHLSALGI
jgi:hypothetical protein